MKLRYIKQPDLDLVADLRNGWEIRNNGAKIELVRVGGVSKFEYDTLEQFNEEWKTVKEPLLYGKLRESLKLWAEYQGFKKIKYIQFSNHSLFRSCDDERYSFYDFEIRTRLYDLQDRKVYDLTDLVGE